MRKGTARRHRQIREFKENMSYAAPPSEEPCMECGRTEEHAEWCLAEDEDD